ncbi:MAG: ATPase, T2SS/T4P/T4SS family [Desulfobulbaceae bacterium]|nr:ATPase, T2SS/T4P/T4SS family [Desulfobulbaceae bacterium]HIJ78339.1 Flp pilus assembly complex ATPase component TadA [Deltaproteobacteria bacterium]
MNQTVFFHKKDKLGAILLQAGKLQAGLLDRALAHQETVSHRLGEILISLGYISEEDLAAALAEQLDLALYCQAAGEEVLTPPLSQPFLRDHPFLLIRREAEGNLLITSDPLDSAILAAAEVCFTAAYTVQLAAEAQLKKMVREHYNLAQQENDGATLLIDEADIDKLKDMASEAPVIKYVNNLIDTAVSRRASDIHMEPFADGLSIRFRIDGILHDFEMPPHAMQPAIISRTKLLAGLDIAERRLPQDGKIAMRVSGKEIDLRVSTLPTVFGEGVVIRILEKGSIILDLASLGMSREIETMFRKIIAVPDGFFLVTGPTGSGKTTTLYCALNHINTGDNKIITVEDPVEYQLHGINQIQVRSEIGLTFASGLRSIVRQDPDVIMIGEIRDLETAEIAVQSSLTGHLVFSTLHTNDAISAVIRMIDLGVERFLISSSLRGVLAQRLVRCICPHCKREKGMISEFGYRANGDDFAIYEGAGCNHCSGTGYSGRIGLYELLVINDTITRGISKGLDLIELRQIAEEEGFKPMFNDGMTKVRQGVTTFAEVVRVCRGTENGQF